MSDEYDVGSWKAEFNPGSAISSSLSYKTYRKHIELHLKSIQ